MIGCLAPAQDYSEYKLQSCRTQPLFGAVRPIDVFFHRKIMFPVDSPQKKRVDRTANQEAATLLKNKTKFNNPSRVSCFVQRLTCYMSMRNFHTHRLRILRTHGNQHKPHKSTVF